MLRRRAWELGRGPARQLQVAPLAAAAGSGGGKPADGGSKPTDVPDGGSGGSSATAEQARELRDALSAWRSGRGGGARGGARQGAPPPRGTPAGAAAAGWQPGRGGRAYPNSEAGASMAGLRFNNDQQLDFEPRPVVSLSQHTTRVRQDASVRLNQEICAIFDRLEAQLDAGTLTPEQRLAAAQASLDRVERTLHAVLDDVNMSTLLHRLARLVGHPALPAGGARRDGLSTSRVLPVLVQRFEALLDRILTRDAHAAAEQTLSTTERMARSGKLELSARSLSSAFWALGTLKYPLSRQLLDKIGGAIMLQYGHLKPNHIAMCMMALNATGNTALNGKLLKVLLERTGKLPVEDFEARTLVNIMSAAATAGLTASQGTLDRLSLALLACLPEADAGQLGGLAWGLGKVAGRLGEARLHPQILDALAAAAWRNLGALSPYSLSLTLYGFGLLNYNPGEAFLDAASARMADLLQGMSAWQVTNVIWSFARLDYTPELNRDIWTAGPARDSARQALRRQRWQEASSAAAVAARGAAAAAEAQRAAAAAAARRLLEQGPLRERERLRSLEEQGRSLARRIIAVRQQRQQYEELVEHARRAVAAALARAPSTSVPAAAPSAGGRASWRRALPGMAPAVEVEPAGEAVDESRMGDLISYILTGGPKAALKRRVVVPPTANKCGLESHMDRRTGVTHLKPFYSKEQVLGLLQFPFRPKQAEPAQPHGSGSAEPAAAEAEAAGAAVLGALRGMTTHARQAEREEAPDQVEAAAAAAAAAVRGELEGLDALLPAEDAEGLWQAEAEAAAASEPADAFLEDPELADRGLAGVDDAAAAAAAAAAAQLDLDAVQRREAAAAAAEEEAASEEDEEDEEVEASDDDESEEEEEEEQLEGEGEDDEGEEEGEEGASGGELTRAERLALRRQQRRQEAELRQQQRRAAKKRERDERAAARKERAAAREALRAPGGWRKLGLPPEQLLYRLLADGSRLKVPEKAQQRYFRAKRCTLDEAAERLIPLAPRMSGAELGTAMWSFASLRHVHPELFAALLKRVEDLADDLSWRGISIALYSSAVVRQPPTRELANRLVDRYVGMYKKRQEQQDLGTWDDRVHSLSNIGWTLASFGYLTPDRFRELLALLPQDERTLRGINTAAWCQFHQCALYLEAKHGGHYSDYLPPRMVPRCEAEWQARDTTTSRLQNKVADVLHSMGVQFAEEYQPRAFFFGVDIAIQDRGVRLAVEVDGPQHFAANPPHTPLASTHLRNTLLEMHGWQVVSIPFHVWGKLAGLEQQQEYLQKHVMSRLSPQAPSHAAAASVAAAASAGGTASTSSSRGSRDGKGGGSKGGGSKRGARRRR